MGLDIVLIEDEKDVVDFVTYFLQKEGYQVFPFLRGEDFLEKMDTLLPDVIILDLMLPGIDGLEVFRYIREYPRFRNVPIIMLTAKSDPLDVVLGLEIGADDYVTKPFNPLELIARINALLRRINKSNLKKENSEIISGEFKLNTQSRKLYKNNKEIELTPKEYLIIKNFMENEDKAFTRDEILNLVWGYDYFGDNKIVDVNIRRIREKIEHNPSQPNYIETIWGVGYRWRKD